jgi:hypothetical protein
MAMDFAALRAWVTKHRLQAEAVGVAVLALVVFVGLGIRVRQQLAPARLEASRLSAAAAEVASFRSSFDGASPERDLRLGQIADSLGISVAREYRVALAQDIAARAEALGLKDVRVRIAPSDTGAPPPKPELIRTPVTLAEYSLTVECDGDLASMLSLVNQLPAAVAVQRLVGLSDRTHARYKLWLAVFEGPSSPSTTGAN